MAFKTAERCGEYTLTTGTGTITTAGPPQQMQTFNSGIGTTNTFQYMLLSGNGTDWEQGIGTVTVSGGVTTVARTTVVASTNSNAAISLVATSFMFATDPANIAGNNGLFDQLFGSAQGTIIYRDTNANGWLGLAPGTSGQFLKTLGAAANPSWASVSGGGGGAGGLFSGAMATSIPTAANTGLNTWYSQGSATIGDTNAGILLTIDASHSGVVGRYKTIPSTPYTITALLTMAEGAQNSIFNIGWTDGTKLHIIGLGCGTTTGWQVQVSKWTNATTFSAQDYTGPGTFYEPRVWVRITDDGTTVGFSHSMDGINFSQRFSVARASGFLGASGYTNLGFFGRTTTTGGTNTALTSLLSWAVT